jgi:hypothetical protein
MPLGLTVLDLADYFCKCIVRQLTAGENFGSEVQSAKMS